MRAAQVRQGTRVLLASFIPTHFVELVRLARVLRDSERFHPVIVFAGNYAERAAQARSCVAEGLEVALDSGSQRESSAAPGGHSHRTPPKSPFRDAVNVSIASVPLWIRRERAEVKRAGRALDEAAPDVLVLAEDNAAYPTANWIAAAHERGIPVALVPYTVAGATEFAEALLLNRRHWADRPGNGLAGALFPRWVYEHRGRKLILLPAARVIAKELAGLAPPRPWTLHSGAADAIAVESARMMTHYGFEGLPAEKLRLTGSLADDELARSLQNRSRLRAELTRRLGLVPDQPILLCALPPDQFVFYGSQTEFHSYHKMVAEWVGALAGVPGWNVIIRPHPREQGATAARVGGNVRVTAEDTASLVPLCDVYVASVSATIRWAIACGIPVLNFDSYRLRYGDFDGAPGVLRMESVSQFAAALARVTGDSSHRADLASAQQRIAPDWALLDGRSGERVLSLLGSLAEKRRPVAAA